MSRKISNSLAKMEFQNKKLSLENERLQAQLESSEEHHACLSQELAACKDRLKG